MNFIFIFVFDLFVCLINIYIYICIYIGVYSAAPHLIEEMDFLHGFTGGESGETEAEQPQQEEYLPQYQYQYQASYENSESQTLEEESQYNPDQHEQHVSSVYAPLEGYESGLAGTDTGAGSGHAAASDAPSSSSPTWVRNLHLLREKLQNYDGVELANFFNNYSGVNKSMNVNTFGKALRELIPDLENYPLFNHLETLFPLLDTDNSGDLSCQEFLAGFSVVSFCGLAALHDGFSVMDVDGDGTLSEQEVYHYYQGYIGMLVALSDLPLTHSLEHCKLIVVKQAQVCAEKFFRGVNALRDDPANVDGINLDEFVMAVTKEPELFFMKESFLSDPEAILRYENNLVGSENFNYLPSAPTISTESEAEAEQDHDNYNHESSGVDTTLETSLSFSSSLSQGFGATGEEEGNEEASGGVSPSPNRLQLLNAALEGVDTVCVFFFSLFMFLLIMWCGVGYIVYIYDVYLSIGSVGFVLL